LVLLDHPLIRHGMDSNTTIMNQLPQFSSSRLTTPLVCVSLPGYDSPVWCKLEYLNPSGSTKDRIARYILTKAMRQGELSLGDVVVEASSGSTSIALALACAQLGLSFVAVMPEGVSNERVMIIRAYGADVELTPGADGIGGAIGRAQQLATERGAFWPQQFSNPDNANAHRYETAQEILSQIATDSVDLFVSGVGTGGTLVGVTQGLDDAGCDVTPILARPIDTGLMADVECSSFSGRIPGVVDGLSTIFASADLPNLKEIEVSDSEAIEVTRQLIRSGFPVGPSSGLNYLAAVRAIEQHPSPAPVAVTVFPDRMERYFSTELFANNPTTSNS
jgi:cysteine synthase